MNAQDVLHAWRDFECSFFAGALLAPKIPFRRFLTRERYRVEAGRKLELTPAVVMRRMTKVSPYPYWHFFDAYPPGYLRAVYRGNGIPLPWGNLAQVSDPCPHWAVFRMIDGDRGEPRLADFGAARRRALAALLLPLASCARHGWQSPRTLGRRRSGAGARCQWRAQRVARRFHLRTSACTTAGRRGFRRTHARHLAPSRACSTSRGSRTRSRTPRGSSARAARAVRDRALRARAALARQGDCRPPRRDTGQIERCAPERPSLARDVDSLKLVS